MKIFKTILVSCVVGYLFVPNMYRSFSYNPSNINVSFQLNDDVKTYLMKPYSTVGELRKVIEIPEGYDISHLNDKQVLKDGDVITARKVTATACISLNEGSIEDFVTLSGIGTSTAQKIIDYRNSNGSFVQIEDIMNVKGIKDRLFEKIADYICL